MRDFLTARRPMSTPFGARFDRFFDETLFERLARFRWLLLVAIGAGHLILLSPSVANLSPAIHVAGFVTLVSTAILLTRMGAPLNKTLWAWIIFFVFVVGYYAKIYVLSRFVGTPLMTAINPEWSWVTPAVVGESYYWTTLAYSVFCAIAWVSLGRPFKMQEADLVETTSMAPATIAVVVVVAAGLGIALTFIQWWLGIGILGVPYGRLPYHLDTLIFRARGDLIPALLLLSAWVADRLGKGRLLFAAVGSLVLLAFLGAVVTTSRGEILLTALALALLWILMEKLSVHRVAFLAVVMAVAVLLIPVLTNLRAIEMHRTQTSTTNSTQTSTATSTRATVTHEQLGAVGKAFQAAPAYTFGVHSILFVAIRVTGSDGIWYASRNLPKPLSLGRYSHLVFDQMPVYYSRDVVGVRARDDFREPGLVGALMLLGGIPGLIALLLAYVFTVSWAWRFSADRLRTAPVALTLAAVFILKFTMSGTLLYQEVVAVIVLMVTCELVCRFGTKSLTWSGMAKQTPSVGT